MGGFEALILRTIDYRESSRLVYAYAERGHVTFIARGVRKLKSPLRPLIQRGVLIEADLSRGKLPTLKDATLKARYAGAKRDFDRKSALDAVCEIVYYNVHEQDDHAKLFDFLKRYLRFLSGEVPPHEGLLLFELKFLWFHGAGLQLGGCHVCGSRESLRYDAHTGALVCPTHAERGRPTYGEEIVKALRHLYYADIADYQPLGLQNADAKRLFELSDALYRLHLGFSAKAKAVLKNLL